MEGKMSKLNALLGRRFKASKTEKMSALVNRSNEGELSSFSGVFQISPLSEEEKAALKKILEKYQTKTADLSIDLPLLSTITSEVKAISHQAVILHGERIKRAQAILKNYQDGAFTIYLKTTYGNRQTPYNFLLYYELYSAVSKQIKEIVSEMPRQAIYTLSSRDVPLEKKEEFIRAYQGETKKEILEKLRTLFPLQSEDKRKQRSSKTLLHLLRYSLQLLGKETFSPTPQEKKELAELISAIRSKLHTF